MASLPALIIQRADPAPYETIETNKTSIKRPLSLDKQVDMRKNVDMKSDYNATIPHEWRPLARVFAALGDEHRQRILMLFDRGERLNVGQIAAVSTLARSTVSHHLKILREADVLCSEKIGKEVWFWINRNWLMDTFSNVLAYVRHEC